MSTEYSESQEQTEPEFIATRNYTGPGEKDGWWYVKRWSKEWKGAYQQYGCNDRWMPDNYCKEDFRARRSCWGLIGFSTPPWRKALRTQIRNNNDIGSFVKLTNTYVLVGGDEEDTENFCRMIQGDLPELHVISTSLAGCRVIGCMCVGNKKGLIIPDTVYDTELEHIKEKLPDSVEVKRIEERLSALGNVIACNDSVAIIHPDLDKESEEIIANTLQVEVFRHMIGNHPLVGSYCVLNSRGGLVCPDISNTDLENLSSLLQLPLVSGTVNSGNKVVASGLITNDLLAYAGMKTTAKEFTSIEAAFQLQ